MKRIYQDIIDEMVRAVEKFPNWPSDPLHAVAIVQEECGELVKATLQTVYEPMKSTPKDIRAEAIQTAAMCLRFLMCLDAYQFDTSAVIVVSMRDKPPQQEVSSESSSSV